jgi:HD-GYP domain-containing protein (c-di-GMP phosphodiesterase class II)/pSer/pThr/pTyr-binding forkhead associated (FHA) protein
MVKETELFFHHGAKFFRPGVTLLRKIRSFLKVQTCCCGQAMLHFRLEEVLSQARGPRKRLEYRKNPYIVPLVNGDLVGEHLDCHRLSLHGGTIMPRIALQVVSPPKLEGRYWESTEQLRIGRLEDQEVAVDEPTVSRRHAEIRYTDAGWVIRDLGSTNGTYLNGLRVGMVERKLHLQDLVQCGDVKFMVVVLEEEAMELPSKEIPLNGLVVQQGDQSNWERPLQALARLLSNMPRSADKLLTVLRAIYRVAHSQTLDELLRNILHETLQVLDAQKAAIILWNDKRRRFDIQAVVCKDPQRSGQALFSKSLAQRCLQQGESLLCRDMRIAYEPQANGNTFEETVSSVICAALRSPRQKLGVLHLDRHVTQPPFDEDDLLLADALAATMSAAIERAQLLEKQRETVLETVTALAQSVEMRDPYTCGHVLRVTEYALVLADAIKLDPDKRRVLEVGTPLHDIGKIGIDDAILRKMGPLTPEEFEIMKTHTIKGAAILEALPDLRPYIPIVRHHHERWDGKGYPDGLRGKEIDLLARIVALADAFDAMTTNRPYRPGMPVNQAFQQIYKNAGTQFDPELANVFIKVRLNILEKMWLRSDAQMDNLVPKYIQTALKDRTVLRK